MYRFQTPWMAPKLLSLQRSNTGFLLTGLPKQNSKISDLSYMSLVSRNTSISCASTARDLGVIFNSNMFVFDQICAVSDSCFSHNHDTRRFWICLNHNTAGCHHCYLSYSLYIWLLQLCFLIFLHLSLLVLGSFSMLLLLLLTERQNSPTYLQS